MKLKIILVAIILLAFVGIADASYALYQHYAPPDTSSCDVNETVSCTAVNQSEYSMLYGVPVAGMGIAGYVVIAILATAAMAPFASQRTIGWLLLLASLAALAFSLWLTWIELFVLNAVCPLCVLSLSLIAAITVLSIAVILMGRRDTGPQRLEP